MLRLRDARRLHCGCGFCLSSASSSCLAAWHAAGTACSPRSAAAMCRSSVSSASFMAMYCGMKRAVFGSTSTEAKVWLAAVDSSAGMVRSLYEGSCVADLREGQPPCCTCERMIWASVLVRYLSHVQAASGCLLLRPMLMWPGVVKVVDWPVRGARASGTTLNLKVVTSRRLPNAPRLARHMATLPATFGLGPSATPGLPVVTPCLVTRSTANCSAWTAGASATVTRVKSALKRSAPLLQSQGRRLLPLGKVPIPACTI